MRLTKDIITDIQSFQKDNGNWLRLDDLVNELWENGNPEQGMDALFEVFEKYPTDDGAGVFWSIVHGLETLNYEQKLYDSLHKQPSLMAILMLRRIENKSSKTIAGKSITALKLSIKGNPITKAELLNHL